MVPNAGAHLLPEAPGSQGMLPGPRPLRTVHESLPSHGSSPYCWLSMSLVVRMMTPPMHQHAVLLVVVTTLVFGSDVVIVKRIAVIERHLTKARVKPRRSGRGYKRVAAKRQFLVAAARQFPQA